MNGSLPHLLLFYNEILLRAATAPVPVRLEEIERFTGVRISNEATANPLFLPGLEVGKAKPQANDSTRGVAG